MIEVLLGLSEYLDEYFGKEITIFGQMPDDVDEFILLNFKAGISPNYAFSRGDAYRRMPFLQVVVRSNDYFKGMDMADKTMRHLEKFTGYIGEQHILNIRATSDILENGRDTSNRYMFLNNMIVDVNLKEE